MGKKFYVHEIIVRFAEIFFVLIRYIG